jgi:diadenosine tetraphosphatase ApaH/serine/threonine PP2A family protein phosphatase
MRLAFLGEIQGCLPALEAALAEIERRRVDVVLHTGNVVGAWPWPGEVISLLRERGIKGVRGLLDDAVGSGHMPAPAGPGHRGREALCRWNRARLSRRDRQWLAELPFQMRAGSGSMEAAVFHATPVDLQMPPHEHQGDDFFREIAGYTGARVNVFGATGRPFWRVVDGRWFVNTGGVGISAEADGRPCVALLDVNGGAAVRIQRLEHDLRPGESNGRHGELPDGAREYLAGL